MSFFRKPSGKGLSQEDKYSIESTLHSQKREIGDLSQLKTINRSSLAEATNEITVRLGEIIRYNINNYPGDSLNEKWDNMRKHFIPFQQKEILIPTPTEGCAGAIKTGTGWKWKLTSPLLFDDKCNCSKILIYDEIVSSTNIEAAIRIDDTAKPEDIDFVYGIRIRGDSKNDRKIGVGIDIRSGARINFFGQCLINDVDYGVIVGGEKQSAPASVTFDKLSVGFPNECGVLVYGKMTDSTILANDINIQILQQEGKDAVRFQGKVIGADIRNIVYNTDIPKNGYIANDAKNVVRVIPSDGMQLRNLTIGNIFGNNAECGFKSENIYGEKSKPKNIDIGHIRVSHTAGDPPAFNIDFIENIRISSIGEYNTSIIGASATFPTLEKKTNTKSITDSSHKLVVNNMARRTNIGIYDLPSSADYPLGTVVSVQNSNGNRIYIKHKETGVANDDFVQIDSQMYIPNVSTLPTASWQLRGKLYMVWGTSGVADEIFICVKEASSQYVWRQLS